MSAIVVSFRRADSGEAVGAIQEWLAARGAARALWMDDGTVPPGQGSRAAIEGAVGSAGVMLVVMGPRWPLAVARPETPPLDPATDGAFQEVVFALQHQVPVIPVLVQGAPMPSADALPPSLAALARLAPVSVRPMPDFVADMERLAAAIRSVAPTVALAASAPVAPPPGMSPGMPPGMPMPAVGWPPAPQAGAPMGMPMGAMPGARMYAAPGVAAPTAVMAPPSVGSIVAGFVRHPLAVVGLLALAAIVVGALLGPAITHIDPNHISLEDISAGISGHHWLGTDELGRDEFTRLLVGARDPLRFGALILVLATVLGSVVMLVGGQSSAKPSLLLTRAPEFLLAPIGAVVLLIAMPSVFQTQLTKGAVPGYIDPTHAFVVPILALEGLRLGYFALSAPRSLRVLARGPEFLLAPLLAILLLVFSFRALDLPGQLGTTTATRVILPVVVVGVVLAGIYLLVYFLSGANSAPVTMAGPPRTLGSALQPALVAGLWLAGDAVLIKTVVNFFSAQPPTADWGLMLGSSIPYYIVQPLLWYAPLVAVLATVLSLNLIGFGLRRD